MGENSPNLVTLPTSMNMLSLRDNGFTGMYIRVLLGKILKVYLKCEKNKFFIFLKFIWANS
jgi:hypothetical protein